MSSVCSPYHPLGSHCFWWVKLLGLVWVYWPGAHGPSPWLAVYVLMSFTMVGDA